MLPVGSGLARFDADLPSVFLRFSRAGSCLAAGAAAPAPLLGCTCAAAAPAPLLPNCSCSHCCLASLIFFIVVSPFAKRVTCATSHSFAATSSMPSLIFSSSFCDFFDLFSGYS